MSSEKALRTRAAIIAAARGIILKEGIGALTMDRAAQAAGMSKGACMYHFKNKRALHAALIEDYAAHLDGQMKRHEALVPGFVEWFKTFEADSRDWADVGVALLSNFVHDDELMKPVHDWYQKLWFRIQALPEAERLPRFVAIMALEGFFYTRKSIRHLRNSTRRPTASSTKSSWARAPSEERGTRPDSRLPQACIVLRPGAPASGRFRPAFCASRRMRIDFAVSPFRFFQGAVHDCHDRTFLP